jgi:general secretion pathway protein A
VQPPSSPLVQGEPLYEAFYGFREQPFALSTDPRFLFRRARPRRAHDELLTGLRRREGLLLMTGETGTGKTTLCRAVLDALGHRTFSALVLNPYMSDAEVLRVILRDFGLVSRDEIRLGALAKADMPQLLDTLESFLRSLLPLESYAVVVIDEAQSLAPVVLDQIRMLGSFEQDGQRLLQIVLVGQPSLAQTIRSEPLRALNERISRRMTLGALSPKEVDEYIRHRLSIAGGGDVAFAPDAVALVTELSHGLPRRVNLVCDRALEEGRVAGSATIDADMVRRAARAIAGDYESPAGITAHDRDITPEPPAAAADLSRDVSLTFGQKAPARSRGRAVLAAGIVLLLAASLAAGYYVYSRNIVEKGAAVPGLPAAPKLTPGDPPVVKPPPSDAELKALLPPPSAPPPQVAPPN